MDAKTWEDRLAPILPTLEKIGDDTWEEFVTDFGGKTYKWLNTGPPLIMHSLLVANTKKVYDDGTTLSCIGKGLSWRFVYKNEAENWEARLIWKKIDENRLICKPSTKTLSLYANQSIQYPLGVDAETINLVLGWQTEWIEKAALYVVCPNGVRSNSWSFPFNKTAGTSWISIPTVTMPPPKSPTLIPSIVRRK